MKLLKQALDSGTFVITAELQPPKGPDLYDFTAKARKLRKRVQYINITDNQRAIMRLSSLSASKVLLDMGFDPIYQVTCRDRNRLALQSDLLGAHVLGLRNVLALTGDYVTSGDHPDAKPVFDLDAAQLIMCINNLNRGVNLNGDPLNGRTGFFVGAAVNPGAEPLEPQLLSFEKKVAAGAGFFQTQAVFDVKSFSRFMKTARKFNVHVIAGVLLLKSAKMAKFLNEKVPGIKVPPGIIAELESAADPAAHGCEIAARLIKELKGVASGVHIMTIGTEEKVLDILDMLD